MDSIRKMDGGFRMRNSRGLGRLDGLLGLEPFRVIDGAKFNIWIAAPVVSFRLWEGFGRVSTSLEMMLAGKRFAIVVDDELLEVLGDVDGC